MSAPLAFTGRPPTGTTLIELLVVLAVLGIATSIAGLAFHRAQAVPTPASVMSARIAAVRREAIATGRDVSTTVLVDDQLRAVTAHSDGSVLADSVPALDPLSGRFTTDARDDARR
jgi:prepilin-type N-terminal cleavage/methylation domain-containing protein